MKENSNNYQNDVKSIDTIIHALYDVISGEKGKPRDWKREKFLFHPTGRLIVINKNKDNQVKANLMTPDEFINYAEPFLVGEGFYEYEIFRKVEQYENLAHVWSTYGSKKSKFDAKPYACGINSIQLLYDDHRWWVISIYYNKETIHNPIPKEYLVTSN